MASFRWSGEWIGETAQEQRVGEIDEQQPVFALLVSEEANEQAMIIQDGTI